MFFFKKSFGLPKKILTFFLALTMMALSALVQVSAKEFDAGENGGQSILVDDAARDQTPAGEAGMEEYGGQADGADNKAEDPAQPGEESDPMEDPATGDEAEDAIQAGAYANRVGGMLWLDTCDDIDHEIFAGDGIRQEEESPLAGYPVGLFTADDRSAAVREAVTDENGRYAFSSIEPGAYVVGVAATAMDGVEYLLPFRYPDGTEGDNRFAAAYDSERDAYLHAYTGSIEIGGDTVVTDLDAGMRTPPGISPMSVPIGTDGIVVESEAEFRTALADAAYKTIYFGADITMTNSSNNIVAARDLVINGTDPRTGGARHTYTDYSGSSTGQALGGACTNITFQDINVTLRNYYGIYYAANTGATVTFDNVTGSARQFFYGRGTNSILIIKDSGLTLSNTGSGTAQELAENAGTVRFEGTVTARRDASASTLNEFFYLTGSSSTVEIAEGAEVLLDNSLNTSDGNIFYSVGNFTVGRGAKLICYSASGFCEPGQPLTSVTIGQDADVRFICTKSHLYASLYGGSNSTFTMEAGSNFLLYDNETDPAYSICYFTKFMLNSPERFILLNPSARAMGGTYCPVLTATGVSSIRYYSSDQITSLFDTGTYGYTPKRNYANWWAQTSPFNVTANTWSASSPTISTDYSGASVPAGTAAAMTSLASGNFSAASGVYGIEIYGTLYTVTYDGNGASGTAPANDAGVPGDKITLPDGSGMSRTNHTFAGWNTQADGGGASYAAGDPFTFTEDTTLYAQWRQDKCTVSGTLSGGSVGGLTVNYTVGGGSARTIPTDSDGKYIITDVPYGSDIVITPPEQAGFAVNPGRIAVSGISADSTGNDFIYARILCTVTERYVDELTGEAFQNDTYATSTASTYRYGGSLDDIAAGGEIHVYQGYKVGGYRPGDTPDGTGLPAIGGLTADETVYLIYHKVTGTISVTFPTSWDFHVDQDTYPYVETGAMGDRGRYYSFRNESDKPVSVDLTEVREVSSGGLTLVADALGSMPGSNEYSLQLLPAPTDLTGAANGFADTAAGITPGTHTTARLGALDGRYVRQTAPTATTGSVIIGGYYAGYLSAVEKNPQLMLTFQFSLIDET